MVLPNILYGSPQCSLGFRAYKPSLAQHVQLTAFHCYAPGTWETLAGQTIGTNGAATSQMDAMVIVPASGKAFSQSMFYSSWNSTLTRSVPVGYNPGDGTTVYANGAFRGQSTQEVIAIDLMAGSYGPYFVMESANSGYNVGPGDSGGPVYNAPTSVGHAVGRGLIKGATGGSPQGTCSQGDPNAAGPCFSQVVVGQIDEIESTLNLDVG